MKNYEVKAKVIKNFNDSKDGNKPYEENDPITLDRGRFEELEAKGFVVKEEIKEQPKKKKEKEEKTEDENIDRL